MPRQLPLEIWCEVVCAQCARTGPGLHTTAAVPRKELRARALKDGWIIAPTGDAFCSAVCQKHYAEDAAE